MGKVVDDKCVDGVWVTSFRQGGEQYFSRSYKVWLDMAYRCKVGGNWQQRFPTYVGCEIGESFKSPRNFVEWSSKQPGGGVVGYQLDKDLLVHGNKIYSEETCVFLPQALNKFLTDKLSIRGQYPRGVHYNKVVGKLCSKVSVGGKSVHLGYFNNPDEASKAYCKAKEGEARRWAKRLGEGEFLIDSRVIQILENWTVPEDQCHF